MFQEWWLLDPGWNTEHPSKTADWCNKCRNDLYIIFPIKAALQPKDIEIQEWCDTPKDLAWLLDPLKTFVAIRTSGYLMPYLEMHGIM